MKPYALPPVPDGRIRCMTCGTTWGLLAPAGAWSAAHLSAHDRLGDAHILAARRTPRRDSNPRPPA